MTKYLSFWTENGAGFVTWTGEWSHAEMADRLGAKKVNGAGFIQLTRAGELKCEGHSESLDVAALPQDSQLANNLFRME